MDSARSAGAQGILLCISSCLFRSGRLHHTQSPQYPSALDDPASFCQQIILEYSSCCPHGPFIFGTAIRSKLVVDDGVERGWHCLPWCSEWADIIYQFGNSVPGGPESAGATLGAFLDQSCRKFGKLKTLDIRPPIAEAQWVVCFHPFVLPPGGALRAVQSAPALSSPRRRCPFLQHAPQSPVVGLHSAGCFDRAVGGVARRPTLLGYCAQPAAMWQRQNSAAMYENMADACTWTRAHRCTHTPHAMLPESGHAEHDIDTLQHGSTQHVVSISCPREAYGTAAPNGHLRQERGYTGQKTQSNKCRSNEKGWSRTTKPSPRTQATSSFIAQCTLL
ncbi:hypothetical protein B0H19DRAFT_1066596 [Mycena capillaripes]|nr:hypothetical protein B0H19DRAFT_1066596 [Mycena capillaripes]